MASVIPHISATAAEPGNDGIAARLGATWADTRKHLLILRFALFNIVCMAFLGAAYVQGYIHMVLKADSTQLSVVIFIVFLAGLAICGKKVVQVSVDLDNLRNPDTARRSQIKEYLTRLNEHAGTDRSVLASALRLKLSHRIVVVRHIANSLVLLGLIGTVIGFIIALSGIDPEKASDFDSISPMVSTLISGMSTALYTTLVGGILNLWLTVNYQMVATGTVRLITKIQEFGEGDERA